MFIKWTTMDTTLNQELTLYLNSGSRIRPTVDIIQFFEKQEML